ncbi:MAG: hypothetical protein WCP39_03755 [Chlamydiota bacterium]
MSSSLEKAFSSMSLAASTPQGLPIRIVPAHDDDIHGLLQLSNGTMITGSKDCTLKAWTHEGSPIKTLLQKQNYQHWITALCPMPHDFWLSGSRDGIIRVWDQSFQEIHQIQYGMGNFPPHLCKNRNYTRINCIQGARGEDFLFFTGTPCAIQLWNRTAPNPLVQNYQVSDNDWVYCIEPLDENRFISVVGTTILLWEKEKNLQSWKQVDVLFDDQMKLEGKRPFISSLVQMKENPQKMIFVDFYGHVIVSDFQKKTEELLYKEHQGRAWTVVPLEPNIYVTGADDHTIKIWDLRLKHSVRTISNHPGRVSSILIQPNTIVAASCPDDLYNSHEKASLFFWDIRV